MTRTPARGRRQRISAGDRRRRILNAAMEVFAERGYQGASMSEIARAAGITPAVIYDHFASKADLQITLLEEQTAQLLGAVATAVGAAPAEPGPRLRAGVGAFFAFVEQHAFAWRMIFRDPPTEPAVVACHRRIHHSAMLAIARELEANVPESRRAVPDADRQVEMFAQMLKATVNGLAEWWYEHREVPREDLVDRVLEFCWIGLERGASGT
jgi:AcrR family transcriptional regulator